jgi:hypothetical protein
MRIAVAAMAGLALTGCATVTSKPIALDDGFEGSSGIAYFLPRQLGTSINRMI